MSVRVSNWKRNEQINKGITESVRHLKQRNRNNFVLDRSRVWDCACFFKFYFDF